MEQENMNAENSSPEQANADASMGVTPADLKLAKSIVSTIVMKGVKLLAIDFDQTIVDVHTAGFWRKGTDKLCEHVRPCFQALIPAAVEAKGLHVCVVTYSMQPLLIRDLLKMTLPKSCDINKIIIRANTGDWLPEPPPGGIFHGKEHHIAWIVTELSNKKRAIIHPQEILLLDDDIENVKLAQEFGHQAYEVPETVTLENIAEYVNIMEVKKETPPH